MTKTRMNLTNEHPNDRFLRGKFQSKAWRKPPLAPVSGTETVKNSTESRFGLQQGQFTLDWKARRVENAKTWKPYLSFKQQLRKRLALGTCYACLPDQTQSNVETVTNSAKGYTVRAF